MAVCPQCQSERVMSDTPLRGVCNACGFAWDNRPDPYAEDYSWAQANYEKGEEVQPHQERVVNEKAELDEKLTKLRTFFSTETFAGLDAAEQDRLQRQSGIMADYSQVLGERIAAFSE